MHNTTHTVEERIIIIHHSNDGRIPMHIECGMRVVCNNVLSSALNLMRDKNTIKDSSIKKAIDTVNLKLKNICVQ